MVLRLELDHSGIVDIYKALGAYRLIGYVLPHTLDELLKNMNLILYAKEMHKALEQHYPIANWKDQNPYQKHINLPLKERAKYARMLYHLGVISTDYQWVLKEDVLQEFDIDISLRHELFSNEYRVWDYYSYFVHTMDEATRATLRSRYEEMLLTAKWEDNNSLIEILARYCSTKMIDLSKYFNSTFISGKFKYIKECIQNHLSTYGLWCRGHMYVPFQWSQWEEILGHAKDLERDYEQWYCQCFLDLEEYSFVYKSSWYEIDGEDPTLLLENDDLELPVTITNVEAKNYICKLDYFEVEFSFIYNRKSVISFVQIELSNYGELVPSYFDANKFREEIFSKYIEKEIDKIIEYGKH